MAANRRGERDLIQLAERDSLPVVSAYLRHIQTAAAEKVRRALSALPQGTCSFADHLDDGSPIAVTITLADGRAVFDFAGTGPVLAGNLNANRAITTAAVLYVLRALVDEDIPLNQGILAPVEIRLPECLLNPPERERAVDCAAVAGGNVETSQRVVDVLLARAGPGRGQPGDDEQPAVRQSPVRLLRNDLRRGRRHAACCRRLGRAHPHDQHPDYRSGNSGRRYPVRLWQFAIRRGSGGAGLHIGGDGAIRRLEFLAPLEVSLVTSRRGPYPPYGLSGGLPGALGRNLLIRSGGPPEFIAGTAQLSVEPGDELLLETPGGGGWGQTPKP